ncbi:MAG TPA: phosphoribosyltransferase family protein [Galbitalea sp.]|jgi:putative phosphoribosyl transferase
MAQFRDRVDAGRQLAAQLTGLRGTDTVVLGLPRGGVPVAAQVAVALHLPLDVIVVRKLGLPGHPEVAMGAIGEGEVRVVEPDIVASASVTDDQLHRTEVSERAVLDARVQRFRHAHLPLDLTGRAALIVDDGIATGATARAACEVVRRLGAARVIVAVPVGPPEAVHALVEADEVVCLLTPRNFWAVGQYYEDFSQTSDEEVSALLEARPHDD